MKTLLPALLITLIGCSSSDKKSDVAREELPPVAQASLQSQNKPVNGSVTFKQQGDQVLATILIQGLKKNSTHGIHIHEKGVCQGPDYKSAGGHFDPENRKHGDPGSKKHHLGDLGNITADSKGNATKDILIEKWEEGVDLGALVDRSVILHSGKDDLKSQPSGNSGSRIACGVIKFL